MTAAREPRFHHLAELPLDSGETLRDVRQAYHLDGELSPARDNLVVVFHALTGSADAAGGWWSEVVGPGRAIDTERFAVLCPNLLGSCYGTTFARDDPGRALALTPRDQARLIGALVAELGAGEVALAVGGSLGGMVALEWAASFPARTRATVVLAAPAAHPAAAIGWNRIQRRAIEMGGAEGLALARMIATMTYRTAAEFDHRFGRRPAGEGYQVERYLRHHGEKLVRRFDVDSYLALIDAMDAHDVGRGRGGIEKALRAYRGTLVGVGIPGDLLYPVEEVRRWVEAAGATYREVRSLHGHDAFLLEAEQVSAILREALDEALVGRAGIAV